MANSGTLDLAEVRVTALDDTAVDAIASQPDRIPKEKKAADRAAIIAEQEIAQLGEDARTERSPETSSSPPTARTVWLQGVNVCPSLGWSPNGEGGILVHLRRHRMTWHANVIRLPVMDTFWFGQGDGTEMTSNDQEGLSRHRGPGDQGRLGQRAYIVLRPAPLPHAGSKLRRLLEGRRGAVQGQSRCALRHFQRAARYELGRLAEGRRPSK